MVLRGDDVRELQRADDHHHRHGGKDERDFVADHLRDGAHRAKQRVFVVAGPAGHEHREFHRAADGKEKQQAGVEIRHRHVAPERQHRVGEQHGNEHHHRREKMDDLVRRPRHDVLLGQRFDAVGDELAEAAQADFRERNADAVGAVAVLDAADAFALENCDDGEDAGENRQDQRDGQQRRHQRLQGFGNTSQHQLLQHHEELVNLVNQVQLLERLKNLLDLVGHFLSAFQIHEDAGGGVAGAGAAAFALASASALALASAAALTLASAAALTLASALAFSAARTASESFASCA